MCRHAINRASRSMTKAMWTVVGGEGGGSDVPPGSPLRRDGLIPLAIRGAAGCQP